MKDDLSNRMKEFYENRTRIKLPRRTYTIIRIDGKAFHTYTRGLKKPFDKGLMDDMDNTAKYLCEKIQGAQLAYVQSDEISILVTDFDNLNTDMWFDGNLQKMCSVSASMATSKFNQLRWIRFVNEKYNKTTEKVQWVWFEQAGSLKLAEFDSRVFQIPQSIEVENYFIWRQQDATRNSISSCAQSMFSNKELHGKSTNEMQEMLFQGGINWNDYTYREKRGGMILKIPHKIEGKNPQTGKTEEFSRNVWDNIETPIFTEERDVLRKIIPIIL